MLNVFKINNFFEEHQFKESNFIWNTDTYLGVLIGNTVNRRSLGVPICPFYPYCYLEFKLCYLKNLKLFSIGIIQELFESIVLWKKKKADGFLLFLKAFVRNKMWCANITIIMGDICAKWFLDLSFNLAVIDKISIFHEIDPNFTYSQKLYFLSGIELF